MKQRTDHNPFSGYSEARCNKALDHLIDDLAIRGGEPVHISEPLAAVEKELERAKHEQENVGERWDGQS